MQIIAHDYYTQSEKNNTTHVNFWYKLCGRAYTAPTHPKFNYANLEVHFFA